MKVNKLMTTSISLSVASAVSLALLSNTADAAISITNFSFEDPSFGDQGSGSGATGWFGSGGGVYNPQDAQFTGTTGAPGTIPGTGDGVQVAYMNGGSMYQDVGDIVADSIYELTVAIGQRADLGWSDLTISLRASSETGTVLASQTYDAAAAPNGTFSDVSFSFSSADFAGEVGNDLFLVFQAPGVQALYDNVRITETAIPEPSSTALLGLGGLALTLRRRRK